jgi:adenylate kinase
MIVILLGAPGSGKGTQSKVLAEKYGFEHLATGDIFRSEIAEKTALGLKAQEFVKSGRLVPDNIVTEMVAGRLDPSGKYLLDGFPRNIEQAKELDKMLEASKSGINAVILLNVPQPELLKRLTSRRVCTKCAAVYNERTKPSKELGKCDKCGGQVVQRDDDAEATAKKRLMLFEDVTAPLTAYYRGEGVFFEINAAQAPEKVSSELFKIVDETAAVR